MIKLFPFPFIYFSLPPLVWCIVGCIGGIVCQHFSVSLTYIYILFTLLGLLSILLYCINFLSLKTVGILTALALSFCVAYWHYHIKMKRYTSFYTTFVAKPLRCIAIVSSVETSSYKRFKTCVTIATVALGEKEPLCKGSYRFKIHLSSQVNFTTGDTIAIENLQFKPTANTDFKKYLIKEGVIAHVFLPYLKYSIIHRPYFSFRRFIHSTRNRVVENILIKLNSTSAVLFCSLFLGLKPADIARYETLKEHFNAWGIVHYLARSGLHVVLIAFSWTLLLRFIPLPFVIKQLLLLICILLYHLLSWPSISFIRALSTFILYKMCILRAIPTYPLALLSLTCFGILLYNPLQLFFLDFQLSFGLTFALAWFNELRLSRQRSLY